MHTLNLKLSLISGSTKVVDFTKKGNFLKVYPKEGVLVIERLKFSGKDLGLVLISSEMIPLSQIKTIKYKVRSFTFIAMKLMEIKKFRKKTLSSNTITDFTFVGHAEHVDGYEEYAHKVSYSFREMNTTRIDFENICLLSDDLFMNFMTLAISDEIKETEELFSKFGLTLNKKEFDKKILSLKENHFVVKDDYIKKDDLIPLLEENKLNFLWIEFFSHNDSYKVIRFAKKSEK